VIHSAKAETPLEKELRIRALRKAVTGSEVVPYESESQETVRRYAAKVRNPLTAIRAKCVDCCCGSLKEVAECGIYKCALHPFRMGTNPMHKKTRERLDHLEAGGESQDDDEGDGE
jgi:hypothetical protein